MRNTNQEVLKNVCNQTVLVTTDFHWMDKKHQGISQEIFLCSAEEGKPHWLGMAQGE